MAVQSAKSTLITNRDATPSVKTDNIVSGGEFKESEGYVQSVTAADSAGSIYRLCTVPSRARVSSVILQNGAFGGAAAANIGVYYPDYSPFPIAPYGQHPAPGDQGQPIAASLFAAAVSLVAAAGPTDVVNQSGNNSIANQELPLWQAAGLASDPGIDLDICVTLSVAIASQQYLGLKVRYQS